MSDAADDTGRSLLDAVAGKPRGPASTLAATIPAEPVGMASESDEGGEW
jgi:hypothetical protein